MHRIFEALHIRNNIDSARIFDWKEGHFQVQNNHNFARGLKPGSGGEGFSDFFGKIAILKPFKSHFAHS